MRIAVTASFALLLVAGGWLAIPAHAFGDVVTVERVGEIRGRLVDAEGNPLPDQRLELGGPAVETGLHLTVITGPRGEFVFTRLPTGAYVLHLVVAERVVVTRNLELTPESPVVSDLILVRPPARLPGERVSTALHRQGLTVNPWFWAASMFNVEYERRLGARTSWGASTTLTDWDDFRYHTVKGLYRYYPEGLALHGLFLGVRAGVSRVSDRFNDSGAYGVVGAEAGYTRFDKPKQHFVGSLGLGINRLIGRNTAFVSPSRNFPAIRMNFGIGF